MLTATTRLVTLIGHPVAHSRSPQIHNAAFAACGLDWAYVATDVDPVDIESAVLGLRALGFEGANVTVPHKESVLPLLDEVDPAARALGAVNTIVRTGDRLVGYNTDAAGFWAPLASRAEQLAGEAAIVLGAGGAARAVIYALAARSALDRVTVAARRVEQAERLVADLRSHAGHMQLVPLPLAEAAPAVRASRLLVNATPLGMHPDEETTPWPESHDFHTEQIAYDLVYAPRRTRFLREAAAAGAETIGGLEMLIQQAAAAFELWTGRPMPLDAARTAIDEID